MTAATAVFQAAFGYAERRGWHCFPCTPGGKTPMTKHGLLDATRDLATLKIWAQKQPQANIGVRTGPESGVVVLDVDGDDGYESLRALEHAHEPLPVTASVKTPRGGAHFWFGYRGDIPNSAGMLGVGLDVRGTGGYVLAPPSIGPNGNRYEPDEQAPLAPLPEWLRRLMVGNVKADGRREKTPAETWIAIVREGLNEGERNMGLARIVGHLLACGVDEGLVREIARLINRPERPERMVGVK